MTEPVSTQALTSMLDAANKERDYAVGRAEKLEEQIEIMNQRIDKLEEELQYVAAIAALEDELDRLKNVGAGGTI